MDHQDTLEEFEKALAEAKMQVYSLRLFVTGATPKSQQAIENIRKICDEYLPNQYELEVVDIYQQSQLAASEQLLAAPTLIKQFPPPLKKLIGNLSNKEVVMRVLGLEATEQIKEKEE